MQADLTKELCGDRGLSKRLRHGYLLSDFPYPRKPTSPHPTHPFAASPARILQQADRAAQLRPWRQAPSAAPRAFDPSCWEVLGGHSRLPHPGYVGTMRYRVETTLFASRSVGRLLMGWAPRGPICNHGIAIQGSAFAPVPPRANGFELSRLAGNGRAAARSVVKNKPKHQTSRAVSSYCWDRFERKMPGKFKSMPAKNCAFCACA